MIFEICKHNLLTQLNSYWFLHIWWVWLEGYRLKELSNQTHAYFVIWEREILLDVYEFEFEIFC